MAVFHYTADSPNSAHVLPAVLDVINCLSPWHPVVRRSVFFCQSTLGTARRLLCPTQMARSSRERNLPLCRTQLRPDDNRPSLADGRGAYRHTWKNRRS
jgi:hypothetical protein